VTADEYIDRVLDAMPPRTPRRAQIAAELRGHIAERVASGQPLDAALGGLGDPAALAASYLDAVPLTNAPLGPRVLAKLLDIALVLLGVIPLMCITWVLAGSRPYFPILLALLIASGGTFFWVYTVIAEWQAGQTLGKRVFGLAVVREDGMRISGGQAVVRQLPVLFQFYWIDVLFALFTEKSQRAFEMLSKTRVVLAAAE